MANRNENSNPLGTVRRSIWYVLRTVIVISLILGLVFAFFTEGMYISNIYVIVTEGMQMRAEIVLKHGDPAELRQYFTDEFLASDELVNSGKYLDYLIDSYDYRYSIKGVSVLPWGKNGSMTYVERIPVISGSSVSDDVTEPLPSWIPMSYKVQLKKIDGCWLINDLAIIEFNPPEEARPTPDYSQLETSRPSD